MKVLLIGGGIIGLSCAYFLQEEGCEVVIVDKGDLASGCSYGNAGMVVPSHFIPLAAPGMISKGIRWMFDAQSPFYIKPRFNRNLISWGWKFYQAASEQQMQKAIPILRDFGLLSKQLYQDWVKNLDFPFAFTEKGLLMLCREQHSLAEEIKTAHLAKRMNIEAEILSPAEIRQMEPQVSSEVIGGVYFPGDAHLSPDLLLEGLKNLLRAKGVVLKSHCSVEGFEFQGSKISAALTSEEKIEADEFIVASGSWSPGIVQSLGLSLPLQAGKGYSVSLEKPPHLLNHAAILTEAKVAVTPLGQQMRFGGTMEIAGINKTINPRRVRGILQAIPRYYRDYQVPMPPLEKIWSGLRPCSPDGLPYVGRVNRYPNLTIASGHAMMGLSLAPATGKIVSEIISHKNLSLNSPLLSPQRYL